MSKSISDGLYEIFESIPNLIRRRQLATTVTQDCILAFNVFLAKGFALLKINNENVKILNFHTNVTIRSMAIKLITQNPPRFKSLVAFLGLVSSLKDTPFTWDLFSNCT